MDRMRFFLSRLRALLSRRRYEQDLNDELRFHLEEDAEQRATEGLSPKEALNAAHRQFGNAGRIAEDTRAVWTWTWAERWAQDVRYGWRQILKAKVTSAAAVLSLALALGACLAAFQLVDALLLRPLPVLGADRLFVQVRQGTGFDGKPFAFDGCEYPLFTRYRTALQGKAELVGVSYAARTDLTYSSLQEMEKAQVQYVSGGLFHIFGLQPALGRVLSEADDLTPGAHPQAVISHEYWTRRFAQDPHVTGKTFRLGNDLFEVVGVLEAKFTGTEPGAMVDIYLPAAMHPHVSRTGSTWLRALVRLERGVTAEPVRDRMQSLLRTYQEERSGGFKGLSRANIDRLIDQKVMLQPATAGVSGLQNRYRTGLVAIGVLVGLVLLIACTNVANLMVARASARRREMALRVSIGARRARLLQLVLIESGWIAGLAAALGAVFAWPAAPLVVSLINPADNPARLHLTTDARVLAFGLLLTFAVTLLFGLFPALRASNVTPARALKGGEDPHARGRLMHLLIGVQMAFCVVVLFVGGLFLSTYNRLANEPTGFSSDRLLALYTVAGQPQVPVAWEAVASHLRTVRGVEAVALCDRPLLDGSGWNNFISVNGVNNAEKVTFLRAISPGWLTAMGMGLLDGRDLHARDQHPGVAVVNQTFGRTYFGGQNPVGRWFHIGGPDGRRTRYEIVGLTTDAKYRSMREPILPVAYLPFAEKDPEGAPQPRGEATLIIRTKMTDSVALAQTLRREVVKARSEFRVSNIRTQQELVDQHTVRERLLAMLALFFAVVALLLAGIGVFGVLDYSVLQRTREIGIRLAIGASAQDVVRQITGHAFAMALGGAAVGLVLGRASEHWIKVLLYGVEATDWSTLAAPALTMLAVALLASAAPVIRALRTDPAQVLRSE